MKSYTTVVLFLVHTMKIQMALAQSSCTGYPAAPAQTARATIQFANAFANENKQFVQVEGVVTADLRDTSYNGGGNCAGSFIEGDHILVNGNLTTFRGIPQIVDTVNVQTLCANPTQVSARCPSLCYELDIVSKTLPVESLDEYDQHKNELVHIKSDMTITDTFSMKFGQIGLSQGGRLFSASMYHEPGSQALLDYENLNARRRLELDDGSTQTCPVPQLYPQGGIRATNTLRTGSVIPATALDSTAILTFAFGKWTLIPTQFGKNTIPDAIDQFTNPRLLSIPPNKLSPNGGSDQLRIGSANMLNFFITLVVDDNCEDCRGADTADEFRLQEEKLYAAMAELDAAVFALQEVENSDDDQAISTLVDHLNDYIGVPGKYEYIPTGKIGPDVIRNAIIYQPGLVKPYGPSSIKEYTNPEGKSRPSIAQLFTSVEDDKEMFTIVANHLKSKGSPCPENKDGADPALAPYGEGNCGFTRLTHAKQLLEFVDSLCPKTDNIFLIGDFNSHVKDRAIQYMVDQGYVDLASRDISDPYSLGFSGNYGTLDYIMASPGAAAKCSSTMEWHINSDEPILTDYNDAQYSFPSSCSTKPPEYNDNSAFRSSDHDPIITLCDFSAGFVIEENPCPNQDNIAQINTVVKILIGALGACFIVSILITILIVKVGIGSGHRSTKSGQKGPLKNLKIDPKLLAGPINFNPKQPVGASNPVFQQTDGGLSSAV